jgi:hypothetical protein
MLTPFPKECYSSGEDFPKVEIVYEWVEIFGRYYLLPVFYAVGKATS